MSYDGTAFHGWQVQPGMYTVQGKLAAALEQITGERVLPQGSGRTDAGVHALGQVASFALDAPIPAPNLLRALNRTLPSNIRVLAAERVPTNFHARHSAFSKTYEYRIFERKRSSGGEVEDERICSPFLASFAWDCRWALSLDLMQQASTQLCGTHDFSSFAASDPDLAQRANPGSGANPVKTIYSSEFRRTGELLTYRIVGSGFLHHMVRNIVGTLVEVGRGRLRPEDVAQILAARDRSAAGPTAPPHGLFLVKVDYGERL